MWSTGGGETVVAEERLDPDKLGFAFRFAGAFVGSTASGGIGAKKEDSFLWKVASNPDD